jgi:phage regulator Rha-like protein
MFQLSKDELENWRSQFATSKSNSLRSQIATLDKRRGKHRKYLSYAFAEQGVAMLSSVLRSPRAVAVNIEIIRAFVRMRHVLESNRELAKSMGELRSFVLKKSNKVDQEFRRVTSFANDVTCVE